MGGSRHCVTRAFRRRRQARGREQRDVGRLSKEASAQPSPTPGGGCRSNLLRAHAAGGRAQRRRRHCAEPCLPGACARRQSGACCGLPGRQLEVHRKPTDAQLPRPGPAADPTLRRRVPGLQGIKSKPRCRQEPSPRLALRPRAFPASWDFGRDFLRTAQRPNPLICGMAYQGFQAKTHRLRIGACTASCLRFLEELVVHVESLLHTSNGAMLIRRF